MCIFCSAKSLSISTIVVATTLSSVQVAQTDTRVENNQFGNPSLISTNGGGFSCEAIGNSVAAANYGLLKLPKSGRI